MYSVHRSFRLLPAEGYAKGKLQDSSNILSTYHLADGRLELKDERTLGHGTDPRVVSDDKMAFVFQLMRRDADQEKSFYRVLKLPDEVSFDIEDVDGLPLGKNWQPFLKDGKLYAVYGFDPLTVLEISEGGRTKVVASKPTQLDIFPPHQRFSMFRGGTNGVMADDGCLYGVGHTTVRNFRHDIFMWRLDSSWNLDIRLSPDTIELNERGFLITDPTSLFVHDGALYLGLALSERDWYFEQKFADILIRLPGRTLPEMFTNTGPFLPPLDLSATGAITMSLPPGLCQTDVGSATANGRLMNKGRAGRLLKGCRLPVNTLGQRLTQVKIYFTGTDQDATSTIKATIWSDDGKCLGDWTISERGKVKFSLDVLGHMSIGLEAVELRLSCSGVDITLENVRAIYTTGSHVGSGAR